MTWKSLPCLALAVLSTLGASHGATLTVTNTADSGDGTLRQAILDANADASPDLVTIAFNIPGAGVQTIAPLSGLPVITRPVTIDGYTQPGASPNTLADADNAVLLIELSGASLGAPAYGLRFSASGSTARGLVINRTSAGVAGILLQSVEGCVIEGCFLGTDATGTNAAANDTAIEVAVGGANRIGGSGVAERNIISGNLYGIFLGSSVSNEVSGNFVGLGADGATRVQNSKGIFLYHASCNRVGGSTSGARNVISGNAQGVQIAQGGGHVIQGNHIGTDASGTILQGNVIGIAVSESSSNLIGGYTAAAGNLISGNSEDGLEILGSSATNNVVAGNRVGTDATGTSALGNGPYGIFVGDGASGNVIGGTTAGAGNVISGNAAYGLAIYNSSTTGNVVQGNFIGTDNAGALAVSNGNSGVLIVGASGTLVGGLAPGAPNVIAFHPRVGVAMTQDSATNNAVIRNRIFANGDLGIDLGFDGVTPNDPGDADGSPNHFQNFPEITSAALMGGDLLVRYRVDSAVANSAYPMTVEFFLADSLSSGQGRTFIHRTTYDTEQTFTNITFTPAAPVNDGDPLVATATDANGNTSEFSAAASAKENHPPVVSSPISDQSRTYGSAFSSTFPVDTFSDPEAGDALTYAASGLPPGVTFDGATRTFSGTNSAIGTFTVTVTATDDGTPPLSVNDMFDIVVAKAAMVVTADNKRRLPGQSNPPLTGTLTGVTNNDNITATFETAAIPGSPPGDFPITPVFSDPDGRLPNYNVTTNAGTLTVVDCSMLSIATAALPNAIEGASYSVTLVAANGSAPFSFALTAGTLPDPLTLAASGLLSGTATNTGSYPLTITATSADGCIVSSNYTLTVVCPTLTVNPASLPAASPNVAYSLSITASGGTAPRAFALTSGTLPTGLTLSSAGLLSGTPTVLESSTFTVTATDTAGCTGSRGYTLTVACPALVLSPATLPVAIKDSAYNVTLATANGVAPYTYALASGALPGGLALTSGGMICGAPTAAGSFSFTVRATDANGCTGSRAYTLTLESPVYEGFAYAVDALLNGQNGGTGFSTAWSGSSGFGIMQNSIQLGPGAPSSGNSLGIGAGTISRRLTSSIGAAGTVRYLSFSVTFIYPFGFPSGERIGLTLNGTTGPGVFIGKPDTGSQFNWVLENAAGGLPVVGPALFVGPPSAQERVVVKCEFFAGNDRFTLYVNPPPGPLEPASGTVKFNSDVGTVTNIAFVALNKGFDFWTVDEIRMGSSYAVVVPSGPAIILSPTSLSQGSQGVAYSQTLSASGGTAPYTFAVTGGSLPNGLTLSSSGLLSGTPTTVGTFSFTVTATDAAGCSGSQNYSVTIPCPNIVLSPASLPQGTEGAAYSQTITASGGAAPYTYAAIGTLPPGLTFSGAGTLSGIPTVSGTYSFNLTATDTSHCSNSVFYSMSVTPDNRWVGDGGPNRWNFADANWTKGLYHDGDIVLFDDGGSNNVPVDITTVVRPVTVTVNAAKSYVLSGGGGIAGATGLSKTGSGQLTVAASNNYSGVTTVSGGRLNVQNNDALGTTAGGTIVADGGSLDIGGSGLNIAEPLSLRVQYVSDGLAPTNGALNNLANSNTWSGPITLGTNSVIRSVAGFLNLNSGTPIAGPGALITAGAGDLLITSDLASSIPFQQHYGSGSVRLTGTNASTGGIFAYSGSTVIAASRALGFGSIYCFGTFEIVVGGTADVNNSIVLSYGKLRVSGGAVTCAGNVLVDDLYGGTIETAAASDRLVFNSPLRQYGASCCGTLTISGPGTVVLNSGLTPLQNGFLGYWQVSGATLVLNHLDALNQAGTVNISDGASLRTGLDGGGRLAYELGVAQGSYRPGRATLGSGVSNYFDIILLGQLIVAPGSNLLAGSTADLGCGEAQLFNHGILSVDNQSGVNARFTVTGSVRQAFSDPFTPYSLTKAGSGTLVLAGDSFYQGGTIVSNGTLRVANLTGSGTGSGGITVLDGGTLAGIGRISGPVTIRSGGTLSPGNSIGTLNITNNLLFMAGSTNLMEVNLSTSTRDVVARLTNVTYGGTLVLSRLGAAAYANGNSLKLFDAKQYFGVFASIQPSSPGAGLQWDITSLAVNGTLKVITGANQWPVVANPIPDQNASYGVSFNLTFDANTFSDPDVGQSLSYTASGMPPGIAFNPATRTFSGATTSRGTFEVTVIATDDGPSPLSTSDSFNIVIPFCPALGISPGTLPQPTVGSAYTQTITANGGVAPYNFTVTGGALPAGLTLSASGTLSGTPTASDNYLFTVTAIDAENCPGSANYSLFVRTNGPGTVELAAARFAHTATLLPKAMILVAGGFGASGPLAKAELYNQATGRWVETAPMNSVRYSATATLLPNGMVLVAGGISTGGASDALASAELYDPATGTWTPTGAMSTTHWSHTATLLPNGMVLVAGGYNGDSSKLSVAELYDPATGAWTPTGSLKTGRYYHTATLLPDGKVLVCGGYNYNFDTGLVLTSAELYDPVTGTWRTTGAMSNPRNVHSATLLPNGKVLVAGGSYGSGSGAAVSSAELYEPASGTWSTTGSLVISHAYHTATLLPNGKVLVAGGASGSENLSNLEVYDPATGTWTASGTMSTARNGHTATLLPNGKVLFVAGYGAGAPLSSAETYDSAIGTWTATGSLTTARDYPASALLPNGKVLVSGGYNADLVAASSAELYDSTSGTWSATGMPIAGRIQHTAILLPNGKVLVAGGYDTSGTVLASAELYDPASETWTATGPLTTARLTHTMTLLANGKVLVAAGVDSFGPNHNLASAEVYDPATGMWTVTAGLATARSGHTATLLPDGRVLVVGGTGSSGILPSAELYDPATGTWSPTGPLASARVGHTATLLPDDNVLVAGGTGGGVLSSAERYDPATGTWTTISALANPRTGHTAILLPNGKVLITAGQGNSGYLSSAELYDPATGTWAGTGPLGTARGDCKALLLPNGKVLVAGGYNTTSLYLSSAELYDVGLGFNAAWQPQLATATSPLIPGGSLVLTGSRFRGISEGSAGNSQDSPADYPAVQLRSVESGQTAFLQPTSWSANSFTSAPVAGFPFGYALVTVFVNGIPSASGIIRVDTAAAPTAILLTNPLVLPNGLFQFSFANTSGATFTALATTDLTMPMSSWTVLGPVTEVAPGQFQFTDPQAATGLQRFYGVRSP